VASAWATLSPTFTVTSSQAFTYFRLVSNILLGAGTAASISQITFNGTIEGPNVTADGRLGLGVSNPVQALEVAGNMIVNGTVSSQSTTFRNVLYNGDMRINQRGISTTVGSPSSMGTSSSGYALDRWLCFRGSYAGGANVSQGTMTSVDLPYQNDGLVNFLRVGRAVGDTSTNAIIVVNALETKDSIRLAGKYVTMSFYYRTGAAFAGNFQPVIATSTGTDQNYSTAWAGSVVQSPPVLPASAAWTKYSFSAQVPLNATQVAAYVQYYPSTATAVANDYFDITGVQLEKGTLATPFEVRPYAVELQLCQRYYYTAYLQTVLATYGSAAYANFIYYKVPMRTNPVPTFTTNNFYPTAGGSAVSVAPTVYGNTTEGFSFNLAVTTYSWGNIGFAASAEL
jgi:hypothetical protein